MYQLLRRKNIALTRIHGSLVENETRRWSWYENTHDLNVFAQKGVTFKKLVRKVAVSSYLCQKKVELDIIVHLLRVYIHRNRHSSSTFCSETEGGQLGSCCGVMTRETQNPVSFVLRRWDALLPTRLEEQWASVRAEPLQWWSEKKHFRPHCFWRVVWNGASSVNLKVLFVNHNSKSSPR